MVVEVDGNQLRCKSTPMNWDKERLGTKPYTLRKIPQDEWPDFVEWDNIDDKKILLMRSTDWDWFIRDVTDVTIFGEVLGDHLVGIGWKHPGWKEVSPNEM